jgi:hypothetical protein
MADRKITDLTALAAGSQATGDLLTIVDVSEGAAADKNKKITVESLFQGIPSNVGIGTSAPTTPLQVHSSTTASTIRITNSTSGATSSDGLIIQESGNDAYIWNKENSFISLGTNNTERMRIDSSGNLGIGTTSPGAKLDVNGGLRLATGNTISTTSSGGTVQIQGGATFPGGNILLGGGSGTDDIRFRTTGASATSTERMRINSSGNVGIGSSSPGHELVVRGSQPFLELRSSDTGNHAGEDVFSGILFGTDDTSTAVDPHGFIKAVHTRAGSGHSSADAGLTFGTSASTTAPATERMRITSDGDVLIGQSSTDTPGFGNTTLGAAFENLGADGVAFFASRSNNICAGFNRAQDGTVVQFASAGTIEGSISISGSDCNFNGATLTRWSQLAGGAERVEILRGSVLSNLDEMCVWAHAAQDEVLWTAEDELPEGVSVGDVKTPARDAYTELNEQMNRMKVSDVEGDLNVAGVFRCWDDDDDTFTNDFFCAMTGDFVIRIAQGTTVARGDLLMSAGDGTAKPQDDDIVRSKTIAKVTSTTVSTTYADGSYCVPCVLMAC